MKIQLHVGTKTDLSFNLRHSSISRMMAKNRDRQVLDLQLAILVNLLQIYPLIGQKTVVILDLCHTKLPYVFVSIINLSGNPEVNLHTPSSV